MAEVCLGSLQKLETVVIVEAILGQMQEGPRARWLYSKQDPKDITFTSLRNDLSLGITPLPQRIPHVN